jgi:hypothetical protein
MIAKQLSVFLENKTGRLYDVTALLGSAGINMSAFTIADASDFGILRAIVSDPEKSVKILREHSYSAHLTEVIALSCPNEPGALAKALAVLSDEGVEIEYIYAFSMKLSANVIIKPNDIKACLEVFQKHELELIASSELYKF